MARRDNARLLARGLLVLLCSSASLLLLPRRASAIPTAAPPDGGSDQNTGIHFMEMDVYGMAVPLAVHASLPDKVLDLPLLGDASDHSDRHASVTLVGGSVPTASGMHFDGDGDW